MTWRAGCRRSCRRISGKSELAKAIRYALARMRKLRPYLEHGCLEADNNGAERALKPVALGRKNYLFVGSEGGGRVGGHRLHPDRDRQAERRRSASLAHRCARPHRRPQDHPDRRAAALALRCGRSVTAATGAAPDGASRTLSDKPRRRCNNANDIGEQFRCTFDPSADVRQAVAATIAAALACLVAPAAALAQNAYITNNGSDTVSVIDTATNTVVGSPITVGADPHRRGGHAGRQQGLCRQHGSDTVSVIDTATNTVVGPRSPSAIIPSAWRSRRTAARSMSPTRAPTPCR